MAVRRVTASSVPDVIVVRVTADCGRATITAAATIGNPANSEWVDAAIGNFDGTGTKIALLNNAHSQLVLAELTALGTLHVVYAADLEINATRPWKALAAGDLDNDGRDELIAARQVSDGLGATVLVYKWNGTDFQFVATSALGNNGNSNWASMAVGDFNGDGRAAIALVKNAHANFIVLDLPAGPRSCGPWRRRNLDSAASQSWRGLTATDWLGADAGADELIAVRAAHEPYRTDLFVYGHPFHRMARDTGLAGTKALFAQPWLPAGASPEQIDMYMTNLKSALTKTHTNTVNWLIAPPPLPDEPPRTPDYTHLVWFLKATQSFAVDGRQLRVWVTLMPPKDAESPLEDVRPATSWNALEEFGQQTEGEDKIGHYLRGWGRCSVRLAHDYHHLIALGIDDFLEYPELYPGDYVAEMQAHMRSQAPWMSFVPTGYYRDFLMRQNNAKEVPDITRTVDSVLFYFRNEAHHKVHGKFFGCLQDPCGLNSVQYLPEEFAAVRSQLPAGRHLQLGTYWAPLWSEYAGQDWPSPHYDHALVSKAFTMPEVGGVTAYTAGEILAGFDVHAPFIGPTCTSTNVLDSKYCILQQLYSPGQSATSDILWRSVNGANVIWPGARAQGTGSPR